MPDKDFSRRVHEAIVPITDRYVIESGRPDRVGVAAFDERNPLLDYTETHFPARPLPFVAEWFGQMVVSRVAKIPQEIFRGVLLPAFAAKAGQILAHRLERPLVQLADHTPNQLPAATQFAGLLALTDQLRGGTRDSRLRGLMRQSHGIGTLGYRPLTVRVAPALPWVHIGSLGQRLTNTHYSIPATLQYRQLAINRSDRRQYNDTFADNLIRAMEDPPARLSRGIATRRIRPQHMYPECVMNPVGTKESVQGDTVIIPAAHRATSMLITALQADILPVYTAFRHDDAGKIVAGFCEVGDIIPADTNGLQGSAVDHYLTCLAGYRSAHEDRKVVYAGASSS